MDLELDVVRASQNDIVLNFGEGVIGMKALDGGLRSRRACFLTLVSLPGYSSIPFMPSHGGWELGGLLGGRHGGRRCVGSIVGMMGLGSRALGSCRKEFVHLDIEGGHRGRRYSMMICGSFR